MAVTHEPWPSFEDATLTDWAPIRALLAAIDERRAVADAVNGTAVQQIEAFGWTGLGPGFAPDRAALEKIRDAICALAATFVFPDDEAYAANGYATFPVREIAFGGVNCFPPDASRPLLGEHSIVDPPDPGASELDPAALDRYRNWLANCAWWLERLRYLDASPCCRYRRKAVLSRVDYSYTALWDGPGRGPYIIDEIGQPIGRTIRTGVSFEEAEEGYPASSPSYLRMTGGAYAYDSHSSGDWYLAELYNNHRAEGEFYSRFVACNPSALDAQLLLVPVPSTGTGLMQERGSSTQTTDDAPRRALDEYGDVVWCLDSFEERATYERFTLGEWRPVEESETRYFSTGGSPDAKWRWERSSVERDYAPYGPEAISRASFSYGTTKEKISSIFNRDGPAVFGNEFLAGGFVGGTFEFDSFGDRPPGAADVYRCGVSAPYGIVRAQSEVDFSSDGFDNRDYIPAPDRWIEYLAREAGIVDSAPRPSLRTCDFDFISRRILFPLFDYGPYFAYGRSSA